MIYFDNYLKFDSKEQYQETDLGTLTIKVIGNVYIWTGNILTDEEGNEYREVGIADGYYVNVRGEQPLANDLLRYDYVPENDFPVKRWKKSS